MNAYIHEIYITYRHNLHHFALSPVNKLERSSASTLDY